MGFTAAIQQALCSLDAKLSGLHGKWAKELTGVEVSVKSVKITGEIPQIIARRNPKRTELWIHNAGDTELFLAPDIGSIDENIYSLPIAVKDTIILNAHNYSQLFKGGIVGFWAAEASPESTAKVTEYFIE